MLKLIFFLLLLIYSQIVVADDKFISIKLHKVELSEAIQIIANKMNINVIISENVVGMVSLQLKDAKLSEVFQFLITSHGLAKWHSANNYYIAPQAELLKRKEEILKWDEAKLEMAKLYVKDWQVKYSRAMEIAALLQDDHHSLLSKRGQVRVDKRTNTVFVQDIAKNINHVQELIKKLDVPVKQVAIEARLASVDKDYERELGLHFSSVAKELPNKLSLGMPNQSKSYSVMVARLADGSLLDAKLTALEKNGHAELLSSPRLLTADQQSASIESGEEVPYQEISESGGTATVFKKAVLGLRVTPQILPGNRVLLHLHINQDRPSQRMVQGVPTISTRQMTTNILVKTGQTIVLGGIYESDKENAIEEIPFISQLPVVGWLFRQQRFRVSKRELLIFVTPKMII